MLFHAESVNVPVTFYKLLSSPYTDIKCSSKFKIKKLQQIGVGLHTFSEYALCICNKQY
jgi:hypothetical protein